MIRIAFATLVVVLGLNGSRNRNDAAIRCPLGVNRQHDCSRSLRLAFGVGHGGGNVMLTSTDRLVLQFIGSLGQRANQQVVVIDLDIGHGARLRRSGDRDGRLVADCYSRGIPLHRASHRLILLIAAEMDVLDIETTLIDVQTDAMLTCRNGILTYDTERLEVGGTTSYRHLYHISKEREAVKTVLSEVERSAGFSSGDLSLNLIEPFFLYIDCIFHPAISLSGSGGTARCLAIAYARSTLVIFSCNDGAREFERLLIVRFALGCGTEHVDAAITLISGAVGTGDDSLEILIACGRRSGVLGDVGRFSHRGDKRRGAGHRGASIKIYLLNGLCGHAGTHLDGNNVTLGNFIVSRTNVNGGLLFHAGEGTLGILGLVGSHVFFYPGHSRTFLTVLVKP